MSKPVLSIIIPAYNASKSIRGIVKKILNQGIKNIELIVVDDGSTDKTLNILRGIQSKDKRLVVLSKKNGGPSSARNLGIKKSRGDYIMFVDADDDISSNLFGRMLAMINESESDMVVCGWRVDIHNKDMVHKGYKRISPEHMLIDGNSENLTRFVLKSIGDNGLLYNLWNKIFKADIIKNNNLSFREDLRFGEDLTFAFRYFALIDQFLIIPDVLYYYQIGDGGLFSESSLVPEYRIENLKELEAFVGNNADQETLDLASWVRWRWLLSFSVFLSLSKMPLGKKLSSLKLVIKATGPIANTKEFIGTKKLLTQRFAEAFSAWPWLLLALAALVALLKKLVIKVKTIL